MSILRVYAIVPHEDGVHIKEKETFVEVPSILYDNALIEKKNCYNLREYVYHFDSGHLQHHYKLIDYIQAKVGRIDRRNIERINTVA